MQKSADQKRKIFVGRSVSGNEPASLAVALRDTADEARGVRPPLDGAEDRTRVHDHDVEVLRHRERDVLRGALRRHVIDAAIGEVERRGLVEDFVALAHADRDDGADVHDARDAARARGREQVARAFDVDRDGGRRVGGLVADQRGAVDQVPRPPQREGALRHGPGGALGRR